MTSAALGWPPPFRPSSNQAGAKAPVGTGCDEQVSDSSGRGDKCGNSAL